MPWEQRANGKRYFYVYERTGKRVRRVYCGTPDDPEAWLAAELAALAKAATDLRRKAGSRPAAQTGYGTRRA